MSSPKVIILGSGNVASHLLEAFVAARVSCGLWSHNAAHARALAARYAGDTVEVFDSLADIPRDSFFYVIAVSDNAVAAVAALMMQLQAADLGVGSCWVQVRDRYTADGTPSVEIVREILNIPDNYNVECIVTFGYSAETRRPVDTDKLQWEKVFIGSWSDRESEQ